MKTKRPRTLSLDDAVFEKAKKVASKHGVSLSSLVEDLLKDYVDAAQIKETGLVTNVQEIEVEAKK